MPAIIAILAARLKSSLRHAAIVYGLIVLGGLIGLCAIGYALDAAHTELAIRYGAVFASLILSGGLFLAAVLSVVASMALRWRMADKRPVGSSPYSHAPYKAPYSARQLLVGLGAAAAVCGMLSAATSRKLRARLRAKMPL